MCCLCSSQVARLRRSQPLGSRAPFIQTTIRKQVSHEHWFLNDSNALAASLFFWSLYQAFKAIKHWGLLFPGAHSVWVWQRCTEFHYGSIITLGQAEQCTIPPVRMTIEGHVLQVVQQFSRQVTRLCSLSDTTCCRPWTCSFSFSYPSHTSMLSIIVEITQSLLQSSSSCCCHYALALILFHCAHVTHTNNGFTQTHWSTW